MCNFARNVPAGVHVHNYRRTGERESEGGREGEGGGREEGGKEEGGKEGGSEGGRK